MRILLWHGYLLTGTGSNIYTANVARAWRAQGHAVVVMCQDRAARTLPFVDDYVDMPTQALPKIEDGTCVVVRPDIGSVLPVYVYDEYEGFIVKRFTDLTDEELDIYTRRNVSAMEAVIRAFAPDAIITGHEVMGPYIAKRACGATGTDYVAKLHGSALEYAVRLQERYLRYAIEGLSAARAVVGGSRYMVDAAAAAIPGWHHKASVVNPGCDVELFGPADAAPSGPPRLAYVGKLIPQKGVHHLLAALGSTRTPGLE
ncbi:MAG: glycosyltransferase, partial [Actinomycetota bacterium]|nr:glycosyltransferase [Actinomycetota bacterium]